MLSLFEIVYIIWFNIYKDIICFGWLKYVALSRLLICFVRFHILIQICSKSGLCAESIGRKFAPLMSECCEESRVTFDTSA